MKCIVQRVSKAEVTVDSIVKGSINNGLLVLVGFTQDDNSEKIKWMVNKLINLRIFNDSEDKMNLSVKDIGGGLLIISNFTLYGDAKKGFRPSFVEAAKPDTAIPMYEEFISTLRKESDLKVETGEFGADMKVSLINDGPVTIAIEK